MGFTTDNGNVILDVSDLTILDPAALEDRINNIAGVVTVGLFARRGADVILLGTAHGVETLNHRADRAMRRSSPAVRTRAGSSLALELRHERSARPDLATSATSPPTCSASAKPRARAARDRRARRRRTRARISRCTASPPRSAAMREPLLDANARGRRRSARQRARRRVRRPADADRAHRSTRWREGLEEIAALPDPVGEIIGPSRTARPASRSARMRVPLGVVGIIYESRPNVTADAAGLCLKSGNAAILRGGSEAHRAATRRSPRASHEGLRDAGLPERRRAAGRDDRSRRGRLSDRDERTSTSSCRAAARA